MALLDRSPGTRRVHDLASVTAVGRSALTRLAGALLVLGILLAWPAAAFGADPSPSPAPARGADPSPSPAPGTHDVTVGAYINDIQEIDLLTHSYAVDLYVWLRWQDPKIDPSKTLELMNPSQLWATTRTPVYATPRTLPDGSQYQVIRFQGSYSNKFPLEDYPFDRLDLTIVFEDDAYDETAIRYVPDTDPVMMNPNTTLPGYDLGKPTMTVSNALYPTTFGDTSQPHPVPYSRVTIAVPVSRPAIAYLVKIAVPIFLVVIVAALSYLLHSSYVEARIGMGITALVALVALQFSMNTTLPQVGYLTAIDLVYIASFAFVLAVMAQAIATSWLAHRGEHDRAVALDRRMIIVAGAGYTLAILAIFGFAAL